jgi:segregation and condensation protein B
VTPPRPNRGEPTSLELGQAAAARLKGDWQLEADAAPEVVEEPPAEAPPPPAAPFRPRLFSTTESINAEPPPPPVQVVEALLFVGGPPLTADAACAAIRGLTPEQFQHAVEELGRTYRRQRRPYQIQNQSGGHVLTVLPAYRGFRERLFGGVKEARLSQPALDVLAVVAYQQPIAKSEVDTVRGADSGSLLRQLVRLGLIAVQQRADAANPEVRYGTTPRLLSLFGLKNLQDLPRLGETSLVE